LQRDALKLWCLLNIAWEGAEIAICAADDYGR
jgi:hypothetical protein